MSSQIVLVPYGGLCNRLRAISGAYTIARKHNVPLRVCWRNNNECKADFDELFAEVKLEGIAIEPMGLHQVSLFKSRWINGWLPQMLRKLRFDREIVLFSWKQRDIADAYDFAKGRTYIYSCYSMTEHYPLAKMLGLAFDGITSLSIKPIRMIAAFGAIMSFLSFIGIIWAVVDRFMGNTVPGWASTVVIIFLTCGLQMLSLGVIGEYIGKIYMESKHRPRYIISEKTYDDANESPGDNN